jgi:hypothetical protein
MIGLDLLAMIGFEEWRRLIEARGIWLVNIVLACIFGL